MTSRDSLQKLIIASLDYNHSGIPRIILSKILTASSPVRRDVFSYFIFYLHLQMINITVNRFSCIISMYILLTVLHIFLMLLVGRFCRKIKAFYQLSRNREQVILWSYGLISQLAEHCTGITEVMGSNPIFSLSFRNCLSCVKIKSLYLSVNVFGAEH